MTLIFAHVEIKGDEKYRLSKLHYENSSGEKRITTFEYDEYGIMSKAKWETNKGRLPGIKRLVFCSIISTTSDVNTPHSITKQSFFYQNIHTGLS